MLPKLEDETIRQIIVVVSVIFANSLLSNFVWKMVGSIRSRVRLLARVAAAFLALVNLGAATICVLQMLREGPDWFFVLMLLVTTVFAYRIGGATRGKYT